jgi:hypothetical protein
MAGGLRGLMAAHPGWTGALKGAGSFGVEQLMGRLNQPEVPPQFQPGWDQLGGFDGPDENDPAAAQLARLRAYFSGRYGGGGYNA